MKFETHISSNKDGEHQLYGHAISELMQKHTFTETVYLLYTGKLPSDGERILLDTMLVSATEHGVEAPSLYVPRVSAASGNSVSSPSRSGW